MVVHPAVAAAPSLRQIWKKIDDPPCGTMFGKALWAMNIFSDCG